MNRRILIVDDNQAIHHDFRKILGPTDDGTAELAALDAEIFGEELGAQPCSFELDSAFQGEEALAMINRSLAEGQPYALAFVDVRMPPGWDGLRTTVELLKTDPSLGVVICSAYSDHGWDEMSAVFGETDRVLILKKPFDTIEVRQLANALQHRWELAQAAEIKMVDLAALVDTKTRELRELNAKLREEGKTRQRMEMELRLAQKLEAVGQLAAGIAHEINTPMQYVGDNLHFLKDAFDELAMLVDRYHGVKVDLALNQDVAAALQELTKAEVGADLEYIREHVPNAFKRTFEGVEHVSEIVRSMKEFSHPDQRERASASLNKILQNALVVARNEYKYVADVQTDFREIPQVLCHAGDLGQVFLNLIVNAAHAVADAVKTGERGTIIVSTEVVDASSVMVTVRDTGGGIPAAIRDRIFDPFFTTKEVGRGTGQGLAIARTVVDKHGGELSMQSEPGEGAAFFVRLPVGGIANSEQDEI